MLTCAKLIFPRRTLQSSFCVATKLHLLESAGDNYDGQKGTAFGSDQPPLLLAAEVSDAISGQDPNLDCTHNMIWFIVGSVTECLFFFFCESENKNSCDDTG